MQTNILASYLQFARETAYTAGQRTLQYFQTGLKMDTKTDGSPVTQADRDAEQWIRGAIEKKFPAHSILGEEYGGDESAPPSSCRWIIDPIDGTKSFVRGVPLYSVLIGFEVEGRVEAGVAYFPALDEMLYAGRGLGCWWNGRRARVSNIDQLSQSVIGCTDLGGFRKHGQEDAFNRLSSKSWYCPGWGDAYGYLLVATGRIEAMIDPVMAIWDCGPFPPIFEEAGGYFGDWKGTPTIYAGKALATNAALLPEVLRALEPARQEA
jgi:myo-inositol-1(or 4)-monophosphatase